MKIDMLKFFEYCERDIMDKIRLKSTSKMKEMRSYLGSNQGP